jgi:2-C-methyl-D-erythritol 4-phosphate cytidylyltransferase
MAVFSVIVVTAAPATMAAEFGSAFVKIDGREALVRSVELFLNRDNVKQIQAVFMQEDLEEAKRRFGGHFAFAGVKVVGGGARWMEQVAAGMAKIDPQCTHVIVHDAARPAVPFNDIEALMEAAESASAVTLVSPVRSPLVEVDEGGNAMAFHPPSQFMQLLTPQAFAREKLAQLSGRNQEIHASEFKLIKGSPLNLRIGGTGDAGLVKTMLNLLPKPKVKPPSSPFEEAQW